MKKRLIKILCAVLCVAVTAGAAVALGNAFTASDGAFTFNTPTFVKVNTTVTGDIQKATDYEAYMFEIKENGAFSIVLEQENLKDIVDDGWHITLYKIGEDKSYSELAVFKAYLNIVSQSFSEIGIGAGTYCIVVEAGTVFISGEFDVTLVFNKTENFEKELNDTKDNACAISIKNLSGVIYGAASERSEGADTDWFYFDLVHDMRTEIKFTHEEQGMPQAAWVATVLDSDGKTISDFTSKVSETEISTGTLGLKAGRYFVRVDSQNISDITYGIKISLSAIGNFERELNNSLETANTLTLGNTIGGALSQRLLGLDKDYFVFNLEKPTAIKIKFEHEPSTLEKDSNKNGWNIRVFYKDGSDLTSVVKKVSAWKDGELVIDGLGLVAGTYYVCIDADSLSYNSTEYALTVTEENLKNYETEPNNTEEHAKELLINEVYGGALIASGVDYDVDYYKFTLTEQRAVSINFLHERDENDSRTGWNITIINSADNSRVKTFEVSREREFVSSEVMTLGAGTYYVRIENGLESVETPYEITLKG